MPSRYGSILQSLFTDIEQQFATALFLSTPFQDECTVPGERYGICDYTGWAGTANERNEQEEIRFNFWIVSSYGSYTACRDGLIQMTADVRSIIPGLAMKLDRRNVLMDLVYPTVVSSTKRAPITPPNSRGHLWIGDIVVPMVMSVAIGKTMCGEHR